MNIRLADTWDGIRWEEMEAILNVPFISLRNEREIVSEQNQAICGSNNNQQFTGVSITSLNWSTWLMEQERVALLSALSFQLMLDIA